MAADFYVQDEGTLSQREFVVPLADQDLVCTRCTAVASVPGGYDDGKLQ